MAPQRSSSSALVPQLLAWPVSFNTHLLFPGKRLRSESPQHRQLFGFVRFVPYTLRGRLIQYQGGAGTLPTASWMMLFLPRLSSWSENRGNKREIPFPGSLRFVIPSGWPEETALGSHPDRQQATTPGLPPESASRDRSFSPSMVIHKSCLGPRGVSYLDSPEIGGLCSQRIPPPRSSKKRAETRAPSHVS